MVGWISPGTTLAKENSLKLSTTPQRERCATGITETGSGGQAGCPEEERKEKDCCSQLSCTETHLFPLTQEEDYCTVGPLASTLLKNMLQT